jgi:PPOX class probable F420-dependent enzyme
MEERPVARKMTDEEYRDFLLGSVRTATLATVRADGRPHAAPVWYHLDGDAFVFTTGEDTVKGKNIRRDHRVALCIDDERPPFHFVVVEGTADVSEDEADLLRWATRIGGRYMGEDQAEAFGRRNAVPGELLVRVTPTKVLAFMDIAD